MSDLPKGTHVSIEYCNEQIAAWQASGLTQKAYCVQHSLSSATFYRWKKRVERQQEKQPSNAPSQQSRFARAKGSTMDTPSSKQSVEIIVTDDVRLRFPDIANPASIVRLIKALAPCS